MMTMTELTTTLSPKKWTSSGEAWALLIDAPRHELVEIASRPGFDMMEETARTLLRQQAVSDRYAWRMMWPDAWCHDLDNCQCAPCCRLRIPHTAATRMRWPDAQ